MRRMEGSTPLAQTFSDMSTDVGCVMPLNHLEVPASLSACPSLQKCSHKRARETEHEAEEPDRA